MTREEWTRRYAARIKERAGVDDDFALQCAEVGATEYQRENGDVWAEPEEEADIELSYWEE